LLSSLNQIFLKFNIVLYKTSLSVTAKKMLPFCIPIDLKFRLLSIIVKQFFNESLEYKWSFQFMLAHISLLSLLYCQFKIGKKKLSATVTNLSWTKRFFSDFRRNIKMKFYFMLLVLYYLNLYQFCRRKYKVWALKSMTVLW
jgi:hypothetical protein